MLIDLPGVGVDRVVEEPEHPGIAAVVHAVEETPVTARQVHGPDDAEVGDVLHQAGVVAGRVADIHDDAVGRGLGVDGKGGY